MKETIKQILREGIIENEAQKLKPKRVKMDMPIPDDIRQIQQVFKKNGYKLYVVGGAVRDALLGKNPKDYDLATDAVPDKIIELFIKEYGLKETEKNAEGDITGYKLNNGYRINLQGKQFGVVVIYNMPSLPEGIEIATFREDVGSGRRPDSVNFTNIEGDVKRRDLTINALFYDIETGEVVDLVGGIDDLKSGVVRTVGKPEDRFGEDRLRILRAIRFAGRFGSQLDPETDAALVKDASLEGISGERIRDEFIKGLASAKSAKQYLQMVDKYNLFDWIFKGLKLNKRFIDNDDPLVLISMILSPNELTVVSKKLNELKYSSNEVKTISALIAMLNLDPNKPEIAPKLKTLFINSGLSSDQLRNFGSNMGISSQLLDSFEEYVELPRVSGEEAMEKFNITKPGPELGQAIQKMEADLFKSVL
jgi:tRNA nucleotidyltransferase/poly(A) polymerase